MTSQKETEWQHNFNSIKVRLELELVERNAFHNPDFNSIKVRLKLITPSSSMSYLSSFQFHKGTIRTWLVLVHLRLLQNFNSIKVRLELKILFT